MSFPPLHPASQNSLPSGDSKAPSTGSARPRQSPWGLSTQSSSRRGLTPLATDVAPPSSDPSTRRPGSSNSPSVNTSNPSPFTSTFSSVLSSSSRLNTARNTASPALSASPFTPSQTGSQQPQPGQQLSSPRSRTNTPFSTSNLASSIAASATTSQGGGGGSGNGGGATRSHTFSPSISQQSVTSPTSGAFDRNLFNSSSSTPTASQSSVSKIVVTQVFLLLGSITEKEGKAKWESQAEAIRKLVESNGMEVFGKYFRRLIVGNSTQIFAGSNRNVEMPGNYQLLVQEVEKAGKDTEQARKIAEIIDTSEGDTFRDFDLSVFLNHFNLDIISKTIIASSFTQVSRADLRTKAGTILSNLFPSLLQTFANSSNTDNLVTIQNLAIVTFRILRDLPEASREGSEKTQVYLALESRFAKQELAIPSIIRSAMALADVLDGSDSELAVELQRQGPQSTSSLDAAKDFLRRFSKSKPNEAQIAAALLFTALNPETDQYKPDVFVSALREQYSGSISWSKVIENFDREGLVISHEQFLAFYRALLPVEQENPDFDIQLLWGGRWQHPATQLSFALGLTSLLPSQLDATSIPGLRTAYDPRECLDGPEDFVPIVENAQQDPMISLDAVTAIVDAIFGSGGQVSQQDTVIAREVIGAKTVLFTCSVAGIPKPWPTGLQQFLTRMVLNCLQKTQAEYSYILHTLWKQDKHWLATRLIETHLEDPIKLPLLLEHAQEHSWLEDLCTMINGFGIDLAALAHRKGLLDLEEWAEDKLQRGQGELTTALAKFLIIKAQDEMRTVKREQQAPRTVSLAMKSVYAMLAILEEHMKDRREELILLERTCMQAFPRLINYGEGYDDIIQASGEETNTLPPEIDVQMQELYKRMYSAELEVREIIETLRDCKTSNEPGKQDLFCCMIHGLFDEYVCFNDYPLNPLATTAVLFGGIISYRLISNLTLSVGLEMVLEAVRDYNPETPMYKFGLQALLHFLNRLPEWPDFCQQLVQIPGLQGTEAYSRAQDVLRDDGLMRNLADSNGVNGLTDHPGLTNGHHDDFLTSDALVPQFRSVHADLPKNNTERYEEPEEDVQDKVLFVLNNVSEQNFSGKISDLIQVLEPKHYQWFASYLVEQRAKFQPNYQQLYLDLLDSIADKGLWADIQRETYVSVRKVLNAESTMKSTAERTYLKNLATWLGSLTLARDKPIKHNNISFRDLLIEGWETQRLLLVIPFTCEVLAQGARSMVFKPPNPWVMEIIALLLELYDMQELKIQQKFAIEVLLGGFGLPRNGDGLERSTELQKRQDAFQDEMQSPMIHDGIDGFDDLVIGGLSKDRLRNARFSPSNLASTLPELDNRLVFPPTSTSPASHARLRQIVKNAVQRSILEIIGPVVERSVTIATIATKDLIHKDFAQEGDENRVREAFEQMAKALAGSLALVTCKEPLRVSMTNYIRQAANEMPDQALPEGSILMCVNDNLETACSLVEKQAEESVLPEIEVHIESEVDKRRQYRQNHPDQSYRDPIASQWSTYIPEPYKQMPGGLNQQQLEIYQQFARQARGPITHAQTASQDSGKQIPDVLQDAGFPSMPNMPTPAEAPALPHQPQAQQQQGRMLPPSLAARPQAQMNGYVDGATLQDHLQESLAQLSHLTKEEPDLHIRDLPRDSPILQICHRIIDIVGSPPNPDIVTMPTAFIICQALYAEAPSRFEVEVLVQLLKEICQISVNTEIQVAMHFQKQSEDKLLVVPVTAALLEAGILEYNSVDMILARALRGHNTDALQSLSDLLDTLLFDKYPSAFRADFAASLGATSEWLSQEPELEVAKMLMAKLKTVGVPELAKESENNVITVHQHHMHYIFREWLALFAHAEPTDLKLVAFIIQLHQGQVLASQEDLVLFLRLAIESSIKDLERAEIDTTIDLSEAYFSLDALAKLVVFLVKNQQDGEGEVIRSRPDYMTSILSLIVLILNNHHVMRGDGFNQRAFYRLFSCILYEWHDSIRGSSASQDKEMILVFAETLLLLDPRYFPAFTYGWLGLVSHRIFMPAVLKLPEDEGADAFAKIMEVMLIFVSDLLKSATVAAVVKEVYRGVLRVLLILHHDFPEFLAENHFRLCNSIPAHCTQLRNLVLSAFPSSILELPNPFTAGLKFDRLEEIRKAPVISGDITVPLQQGNIQQLIDNCIRSSSIPDEVIGQITEAIYASSAESSTTEHSSLSSGPTLLHAVALYIGQTALESSILTKTQSKPTFSADSPQASLMTKLALELQPEYRYYFLSGIANQLRYPNSHTHYFSYALLHLFGSDHADQQESDVRQQITRVLLERSTVHRPHPWGLIITLLELLRNPVHMFWELPFIKAYPEIEKLIGTLFQHINPSPGSLG